MLFQDLKDQPLLCAAFTYDPNVFQCLIHDKKSIPDGTGIIINEPGKRYSEKFCIDGQININELSFFFAADLPPECGRTQFIRVQQAVIVGYAKNFSSVSSTEECAMRCLKESFPCRSAMYFYEEGECITNSESAQTVPSAFAHEDTDKVIYFQNGCEKVVENQKNMISGIYYTTTLDESIIRSDSCTTTLLFLERQNDGEDIKLKNELESENPTNKDVINEEEAERDMNVELENRKPERVAIFKPEDKNDAKTESGEIKTSPVDSTHLVNMKNDGNPELPPEIKKLNHEENTNGSPEQVGVIPRVVYNEMVEEEKQIGGRKDSREDSMEQFRPHVVQPTIKEIPAKLEQQKHVKQVDTSEDEQRATTADSTEKKSTAAFEMPRVMIQVTVNSSNVTKKQNQVETTTMVVTTTKRFSENVEEATTAANIKNPKHDGQDDIKGLLKKSNRTKVDLENESRGYFSEWNPWTVCKTVGERRIRRRRCLNLRRCIGALTEVAVCKPEDIKSNLRTSPASSSSGTAISYYVLNTDFRTIVSAGLRQPDEVTLNQWTNSNKHNVSVPFGVGSNQKITENPDLWSPWDGNCKKCFLQQFPKIQPCRDHQQIGYESRECLKTNVDECIGPFFRYCTIPC
uniref:Apple domain-containing protein n=1 Tax=Syphacia muris TaxID=451379 RepID=A0A0N5AQ74_9BILA